MKKTYIITALEYLLYVINNSYNINICIEGGPSIGVTDILVNVTYYDFSSGNDDFSSTSGLLPHSPHHVISPLGSWLAISDNPTGDTFSDWFRSTSSNFEKQDQILLEHNSSITSSTVHK